MKLLSKASLFKLMALCLLLSGIVVACKKDKGEDPAVPAESLKAVIDGKNYTVAISELTATRFEDSPDPKKALQITAPLDGGGAQLVFFLNDLANGTINLSPKLGTAVLPKGQPVAEVKGGVDQYYIRYTLGAVNYYAFKGTIEVKTVDNQLTYSWNVTFKDGTAREFTSSGSFTLNLNNYAVKAKSEITDPTPVAAKPAILSVNPGAGKEGDSVTILGTGFSSVISENVVKFNGVPAVLTAAIGGSLQTTVPKGAITGPVTLSVNGGAEVTGPQFTVNTSSAGSSVEYVNILGGNATFSKLTTAADDIKDIYIDKSTNILYYSDFNVLATNAANTVYRMPLSGGSPAKLSSDARITNIAYITTDATGNVYLLKYQDKTGQKATVYKLAADGTAITEVLKDISLLGDGAKKLYVDSQGIIWLGHSDKIENGKYSYVSSHNADGAVDGPLYKGDRIYVANYSGNSILFKSLNLVTGDNTLTDFTYQSLFKQDDDKFDSNAGNARYFNYTIDNDENFYGLYAMAYQSGQLTQSWVIRKTKNGSGTSSVITKFNTKFVAGTLYIEPQGLVGIRPVLAADGAGNLYLKYNSKDIVKITP